MQDAATAQIDLGLVNEVEFAVVQRQPQVVFDLQSFLLGLLELR